MKKFFFFFLALFCLRGVFSQSKIIQTKPLFLRIPPDARASSLGESGASTSPDSFSQYWNPAKYPFSKIYSSIGISISPYLVKMTRLKDMYLVYGSFYSYLNNELKNTIASSIYYYKGGKAYLTQYQKHTGQIINLGESNAYEFYIDLSYAMKLSSYYSMALTLRYIRSDPFNNLSSISTKFQDYQAANSFALDIAGFFKGDKKTYNKFDGFPQIGFTISNIGPKINYFKSNNRRKNSYLPTNLRIGTSYKFLFNKENELAIGMELNKLLVPSPNKQGVMPDKGIIKGILGSFYDAPEGLKEELREIIYSFYIEYALKYLQLRSGYFHEPSQKGARKHMGLGIGMNYEEIIIDLSYLIPFDSRSRKSFLSNVLKLTLSWNFGGPI